jgi:hypothetical protein
MNRIFITPADIAILENVSQKYGATIIRRIKKQLEKKKYQKLTIVEYAAYYNIDLEEVKSALGLIPDPSKNQQAS